MKSYNMLINRCFVHSTLCAVVLIWPVAVQAADESTETSVERRLKQQDQQIRDLQQRLSLVESSAMAGDVSEMTETSEVVVYAQSEPADHPDLGALREKTDVMTRDELVSDQFPGSWPMFGSDTRMKIGGYVKADFVFDLDGTRDASQFLMSTIPVPGMPEYGSDPYFKAFAKETRINFDVRRIQPGGAPLRAFFEGDFFSSGNQFRLRHAYISVGGVLIGQTWTTLSFLESLPFMIDFAAGDALFGGRTTQIRYTKALNDEWTWAVAAEALDLLGIENPNALPGHATTQLPLLATRTDYRWKSGVLFLGTSVAQLHWDGGSTGPSESALQYDFVVAGRQAIGEKSYGTWNVGYGRGSGENIMAFAGSDANAVLDINGNLDTMEALSLVVGCGHEWSEKWSSNASVAYGFLDTPDSRDALALKRGGIAHVNLIWTPVKHVSTGIEFMWGRQRTQNDATGTANRIQLMTKYEF